MFKKTIIVAAVIIASLVNVGETEAATIEVTAQHHAASTFEAIRGAKIEALRQVPCARARIIEYKEMSFPDRFTCRIRCIIEYDK